MVFPVIVNDGVALDLKSSVIEGAAGSQDRLYELVEDFIRDHEAPSIKTQRDRMAPSFLSWMFGNSWEGLTVRNGIDMDLATFVVHILGVDYGSSMVVHF